LPQYITDKNEENNQIGPSGIKGCGFNAYE